MEGFKVRVSWEKVKRRREDDFHFLRAGSPNLTEYVVIFDSVLLRLLVIRSAAVAVIVLAWSCVLVRTIAGF